MRRLKGILVAIIILSMTIIPVYCAETGYEDSLYKKHQEAVDAGEGTHQDLYEKALSGAYSTDIVKQMLNDGYICDYIDELKLNRIIESDFKPSGENIVDNQEETVIGEEIPKVDTVYSECCLTTDISLDESNNIVVKTAKGIKPISVVINGENYNIYEAADIIYGADYYTWVFAPEQIYDYVEDKESVYGMVIVEGVGIGGMWSDGRYWGDYTIACSKLIYGIEKTSNVI